MIALLVASQWKRIIYLISQDFWLLVLVSIAVFSVAWSVAPGSTLPSIRGLIRLSLYGVYLAARYSLSEQMTLIGVVCLLSGLFSILIAVGNPTQGTQVLQGQTVWKGIFPHKNFLSRVMTMSSLLFLNFATDRSQQRNKLFVWTGLIVSIFLVLLTQSKTALSALSITYCLSIFYVVSRQKFRIKAALFAIVILIVSLIGLLIFGNIEYIVIDLLGKNLEFNGRLPLWQLGLDKALERPWLGYGYDAFWNSDESIYVINNSWGKSFANHNTSSNFNIHNGYLELFISLGFIGTFVYLLCFVRDLVKAFIIINVKKDSQAFWLLQYLVFTLLFNMAVGSTILAASNILWSIYISISLAITSSFKKLSRRTSMRMLKENQF